MKAITGNRLSDGRVVYFTSAGAWAEELAEAAQYADADAETFLAEAQARPREVAGAYLIDIDEAGASGRARLRESIRAAGPTIRQDLGKQASNG